MKNTIVWFEIPTTDFDRAIKFYKSIVNWEFIIENMEWTKMAFFPYDRREWVWWTLIHTSNKKNEKQWITVYFSAWESIGKVVSTVEKKWWWDSCKSCFYS